MLTIDGSDGGGQLLRTSLSLSAITETPIRMTGIRGNRPEPGLKPQHLTAVETIATVSTATLEGATLGSEVLEFSPGGIHGGTVQADIQTAGSMTLLFDTLLPLAGELDSPLTVTATGGTEVKWAPPLSTYRHVKLPLCRELGIHSSIERHRTGFYPAGGGRATFAMAPASLRRVQLSQRGSLQGAYLISRESVDLAGKDVAQRQVETAGSILNEHGIEVLEASTVTAETISPGSAISVVLRYDQTRAGFDALGERGKPAETVGESAANEAVSFHEGDAVVDRHTADQLLLFLALTGGRMLIPERTAHVNASLELLETFGYDLACESRTDGVRISTRD